MRENHDFFRGKTIFITGASSGLGEELAQQLSKYPVYLLLVARNLKKLNTFKKEALSQNNDLQVSTFECDVSVKENCKKVIDAVYRKVEQVDFFIFNAGITMWQEFTTLKNPDDLQKIMDTNFMANVYFTYYLLQKKANIDFKPKLAYVSSLQSIIGAPYHSGYTASKHALAGFIKSLQLEIPDLPIMNIVLAWIRGTSLRKNAIGVLLKEVDKFHRGEEKKIFSISKFINDLLVIDVKKCATLIIASLKEDQKELFLPKISFLVPIFYTFFPQWVKGKIKKIVSKEKKIGTKT